MSRMITRPRPDESVYDNDSIKPIKELIIKIDGYSQLPEVTLNGKKIDALKELRLEWLSDNCISGSERNSVLVSYFADKDNFPVIATIGQSIGL